MSFFSDLVGGVEHAVLPLAETILPALGPEGAAIGFGLDFLSSAFGQNQNSANAGGFTSAPAVQPFAPTFTGGSSQLENQLLGSASNLDSQMNSLISQANNPNLSEGQVLKLQTQIQKLTRMYEMISEMLKSMNEAQSTSIHNMVQ